MVRRTEDGTSVRMVRRVGDKTSVRMVRRVEDGVGVGTGGERSEGVAECNEDTYTNFGAPFFSVWRVVMRMKIPDWMPFFAAWFSSERTVLVSCGGAFSLCERRAAWGVQRAACIRSHW